MKNKEEYKIILWTIAALASRSAWEGYGGQADVTNLVRFNRYLFDPRLYGGTGVWRNCRIYE